MSPKVSEDSSRPKKPEWQRGLEEVEMMEVNTPARSNSHTPARSNTPNSKDPRGRVLAPAFEEQASSSKKKAAVSKKKEKGGSKKMGGDSSSKSQRASNKQAATGTRKSRRLSKKPS